MTEIWGKKGSFVSIAMQFLSIYPNPLYIIRCKPNFPHLKTPAFQKESFCTSKGVLLGGKRSPFGRQKGYICNAKGVLFHGAL